LSLRIYVDDCAHDKRLVLLLRAAGHEVVTPAEAGIAGEADEVHMAFAVSQNFILLTKDPDDFAALQASYPVHPGILVIYQDNDPRRDMTYADIVRSIANLEAAGINLGNCVTSLNQWRYK